VYAPSAAASGDRLYTHTGLVALVNRDARSSCLSIHKELQHVVAAPSFCAIGGILCDLSGRPVNWWAKEGRLVACPAKFLDCWVVTYAPREFIKQHIMRQAGEFGRSGLAALLRLPHLNVCCLKSCLC